MDKTHIDALATLRAVVGYLGEKDQCGWWQSSFFSPDSHAFLSPIFSRTYFLARCSGVQNAAAAVHDDRIGIGRVYHLFRLPEDVEQRIHAALHEADLTRTIGEAVAGSDKAAEYLRNRSGAAAGSGIGPTCVGDLHDLRLIEHWRYVAAEYLHGIEAGVEIYPYFADRA